MEPDSATASGSRSANENEEAGSDDESEFGDLMRLMLADFEYWDDVMEKQPEQLRRAYGVAKEKANELRKYLTAAGMLQSTSRGKSGRFVGVGKASCPRPANRLRHSIEQSLQRILAKGRRNGAGVAEYVWAIGYSDGSIRIGSDEVLAPVWQKERFMERVREQGNNIKITTQQFKDSLAATDLATLLSKHLYVAERKAAITTLGRMCTPPMSTTPFGMSFATTTLSWWPSGVTYQKAWTLKGHETILVLTAMAENVVTNYGRGSNLSVEDQRKGCIDVFKSCGVGPSVSAGLKDCDSRKVAILELIGEQALTAWQLPPSKFTDQDSGQSGQGIGAQGQEAQPAQPRRVRRTKEQMGTQPYPCSLCTGAYSTAAGLRKHRCKARQNPMEEHAAGEGVAGAHDAGGEPQSGQNPAEESAPRESPAAESQPRASPRGDNRPRETLPNANEPTESLFKTASEAGAQSFPPKPAPQSETGRCADGQTEPAAGGGEDSDGDSDGAMDELLEEVQRQDSGPRDSVEGQPQTARQVHVNIVREEPAPPLPPQLSGFLPLVFALRDKHASSPASGTLDLVAGLGSLMSVKELPRNLLATLYALNWLTYLVPETAAYRKACTPSSELFAAIHAELGVQHLRKGSNGWAAFLKECEFLDEINRSDREPSRAMAKAQYRLHQVQNNPSLGPSLVAALPRADLATKVKTFCVEAEQSLRSSGVRQGGVAPVGKRRAVPSGIGTGQSDHGGAGVDKRSASPPGKGTGQSNCGGAGVDKRSASPPGKGTEQSDCGGAGVDERSASPPGKGTGQSDCGGAGVDERSAVPPGKGIGQSDCGGARVGERGAAPPIRGTGQSVGDAQSDARVDARSSVFSENGTGQPNCGAQSGAGVNEKSVISPRRETGQSKSGAGVGKKQNDPGTGEGPPQSCGGMKRTAAGRSKRPPFDSLTGDGQAVDRTRKESLRRGARGASARAEIASGSENDPPQPTVTSSERPPKRAASARLVQILKQVTNKK